MGRSLSVLIIDDNAKDVELILQALRRGGYDPDYKNVESAEGLNRALEAQRWDVILLDFLARFNGREALHMVRDKHKLDVPVICVSGTIGEETAVELMMAGAQDYVMTNNLGRLAPALTRELAVAELRGQRREADRKLDQERKLLRQLLDNIPDAIYFKDRQRRLIHFNEGVCRFWNREQVVGQTVDDFAAPQIGALIRDEEIRILTTGEGVFDRIEQHCKADGTIRWYSATKVAIRDTDQEIIGLVGITRDITERRQADEQLRQAQKMEAIGHLTGGVAHDFNNMLMVIIGNLDLLSDAISSNSAARELIDDSMTAALNGADLTRSLLAFGRRQPLQPRQIDLNKLMADQIRLLGRTLGEQIIISADAAGDVWPMVVDPSQLRSALTNLAVNARDSMRNGGNLFFRTFNAIIGEKEIQRDRRLRPGEYVVVEVSDTGAGISPKDLPQIFEPFFTTKELGKGSGLGLSMVYGFVQQSGGQITVRSVVGKGTTFRLYLPRATTAETVENTVAASEMPAHNNETILVVDDDASVRKSVVAQLTKQGYGTVEASAGPDALALIAGNQPIDLLFTDIVMPGGMSGMELARAGRECRPGLKVLFTSGYPGSAYDEIDSFTGYAILSKPYRRGELQRVIRGILDNDTARKSD